MIFLKYAVTNIDDCCCVVISNHINPGHFLTFLLETFCMAGDFLNKRESFMFNQKTKLKLRRNSIIYQLVISVNIDSLGRRASLVSPGTGRVDRGGTTLS